MCLKALIKIIHYLISAENPFPYDFQRQRPFVSTKGKRIGPGKICLHDIIILCQTVKIYIDFNKIMKNSTDTNTPNSHNVEYTTSQFLVHKFIQEITERKIIFHVIKMVDSLFIYINDKDCLQFSDLSFATKNRYDGSSTSTTLLGDCSEDVSKNIACRISKKVNKAVYLSCNIEPDRLLIPLIEKRLYEEMKTNSDIFF